MKITRFQTIRDYRIFRNFLWPATGLPDFARFNLIYGWNGAGKTTLSTSSCTCSNGSASSVIL
ncbi:AAA family ATPase [Solimonas soli]|uniref:AAA family ATPase n=1 Tax=Solimonas soli TaxID=413479 RepID=UPI0009FBC019